eukprot:gene11119-9700_t
MSLCCAVSLCRCGVIPKHIPWSAHTVELLGQWGVP